MFTDSNVWKLTKIKDVIRSPDSRSLESTVEGHSLEFFSSSVFVWTFPFLSQNFLQVRSPETTKRLAVLYRLLRNSSVWDLSVKLVSQVVGGGACIVVGNTVLVSESGCISTSHVL